MLNNLTLQKLNIFMKVLECGSFRKAAQQLFLTQPAITNQIKSLESSLDMQLINRGKNIKPTYAGQLFYQYALNVLKETQYVTATLNELQRQQMEEISIGAAPTAGQYLLPSLLPQLLSTFPFLCIKLRVATSGVLEEMLLNRQIDLAVIFTSDVPAGSKDISYEALGKMPLKIVAAANNSLAQSREIPPEVISVQPFITPLRSTSYFRLVRSTLARHGIIINKVLMEAEDIGAIKKAVKSSQALGVLSSLAVEQEVASQELSVVRSTTGPLGVETCLAFYPQRLREEPFRQVYNFLVKSINDFSTDYNEKTKTVELEVNG